MGLDPPDPRHRRPGDRLRPVRPLDVGRRDGDHLATLSAISNFFFIPYYPIWALLLIGLNIWVIWALTRPGAIRT